MAFERLSDEESLVFKRYIGTYVSRDIVKSGKASVDDLNRLDRVVLAKQWYAYETKSIWIKKRFETIFNSNLYYSFDDFIHDVALFIDERIPRAYIKHYERNKKCGPANIVIKYNEDGTLPHGLIFHYEENYESKATSKQVKFLNDLAIKNSCYFFRYHDILKKEAHVCIDYFLNQDTKPEPKCFSKFFGRQR